jgi:hypothetical protein
VTLGSCPSCIASVLMPELQPAPRRPAKSPPCLP